jgi:TonB family protein
MNAYLNYFIEANIGLVLFLGAYVLFLRNETDFKMQRIFLLAGILISLTLPLLHIQGTGAVIPSLSNIVPAYFLPEFVITANGTSAASSDPSVSIDFWFYLQLFYVTGLAFFLIRFLVWITALVALIKRSSPTVDGKLTIVESEKVVPTFSFFHFIVLGQAHTLSPEDRQKVIRHESVHVHQLHSFDILLINVISIFFWINPFLKTYKKIFVQLHEFEADARAVENRDVNEYCSLLAKVALESAGFKLANHFNNPLTLKRIEMMRTIKRKIKPWKMLAIAGVIPIAFFIIACQDQIANEVADIAKGSTMAIDIPAEVQIKYDELTKANPGKKFLLMETDENMKPKLDEMQKKFENLDQNQIVHIDLITPTVAASEDIRTFAIIEYNGQINDISNRSKLDSDVYTMVEDTAMPVGGMPAFYEHIAQNMMYPAQARQMGIEGKVFVEFVVQTDGSITDVKVKKGIGAGCDEAAMNVVKTSPKWNPAKNKGMIVKQQMVLPIAFKLSGSDKKDEAKAPAEAMEEMVVVGEQ